jgi:hypothetical protein
MFELLSTLNFYGRRSVDLNLQHNIRRKDIRMNEEIWMYKEKYINEKRTKKKEWDEEERKKGLTHLS